MRHKPIRAFLCIVGGVFIITVVLMCILHSDWKIPLGEADLIIQTANERKLSLEDTALLFAIRHHERGKAGYEYGIKRAKGTSFQTQLNVAIECIQYRKRGFYRRYGRNAEYEVFIGHLGGYWCPYPSKDDPRRINKFWIPYVTHYWSHYRKQIIIQDGELTYE